jgi:hypothetical protein
MPAMSMHVQITRYDFTSDEKYFFFSVLCHSDVSEFGVFQHCCVDVLCSFPCIVFIGLEVKEEDDEGEKLLKEFLQISFPCVSGLSWCPNFLGFRWSFL